MFAWGLSRSKIITMLLTCHQKKCLLYKPFRKIDVCNTFGTQGSSQARRNNVGAQQGLWSLAVELFAFCIYIVFIFLSSVDFLFQDNVFEKLFQDYQWSFSLDTRKCVPVSKLTSQMLSADDISGLMKKS